MRWRALVVAAVALCASGCFRTSVYSGVPPGATAFDNRWHSGFIGGWVETSGPYDLSRACPHGWGEIFVKTGGARALVQALTLEIYSPQNVTVVCAAPGTHGPAPVSGYPASPPPASSAYPPPAASAVPPPSPVPLHHKR